MQGRLGSLCRDSWMSMLLACSVLLWFPRFVAADSFNWQNVNGQNWNSPVKSQFGGTCWDFSTIGTFEAKYMLTRNDNTNFVPDMSEQQLCWVTSPYDLGDTGGGWEARALLVCGNLRRGF